MAEFCFDCLCKLDEKKYKKIMFIISKDLDYCEGCGEWKHVVSVARIYYYKRKIRLFLISIASFFCFLKRKILKK